MRISKAMQNFFLSLLLMGIFLFFSVANAAPFQNGNFETGINPPTNENRISVGSTNLTGWTVTSGTAFWTYTHRLYGQYSIYIGCESSTNVSQIFDTIEGNTYTVTYFLFAHNSTGSENNKVEWTVKDTNSSGTILFTRRDSPTQGVLTQYSFTFVASSITTYLSLKSNVPGGGACSVIDNITVTTPPPQTVQYAANYPSDPSHLRLKAIPGQDMVFDFTAVNTGGAHDANATDLKFSTSQHISFKVGSVTCESGRRTVQKAEGGELWQPSENFTTSGVASSGLSACSSGNITYSSTGGTGPWTYTPTGTYDDNVRGIRVQPTGTFASGLSTPTAYRVYWLGKIK
jgi:hypothetical protein